MSYKFMACSWINYSHLPISYWSTPLLLAQTLWERKQEVVPWRPSCTVWQLVNTSNGIQPKCVGLALNFPEYFNKMSPISYFINHIMFLCELLLVIGLNVVISIIPQLRELGIIKSDFQVCYYSFYWPVHWIQLSGCHNPWLATFMWPY